MDDPYKPPKGDIAEQSPKKLLGRTRAQMAFDRCMYVLAGIMVIPMISTMIPDFGGRRIAVAILYAGLVGWWIRSLVGVFESWKEPDARVLRFSGLAVLGLGAFGIIGLLVRHQVFGPG